jgi:hypothetical protein
MQGKHSDLLSSQSQIESLPLENSSPHLSYAWANVGSGGMKMDWIIVNTINPITDNKIALTIILLSMVPPCFKSN